MDTQTTLSNRMPLPPKNHRPIKFAASEMIFRLPPRGERGPTPIGELLKPLQHIIRHPDRNRLLADFFKEK